MGAPARKAHDQQYGVIDITHAQVTADTTEKVRKFKRPFRVDAVQYINPTGLAQSATDYFNIKVLKGSTVVANWSTQTGAQGTLTADTHVNMVLSSTDADLVFAVDDILSLFLDETGTATLPAGRVQISGRYL